MRLFASWTATLLLLTASIPVHAETPQEKAAALRDSSCRTCHGETGNSSSDTTPRLNGQNAGYLRSRLESFRYPIKEAPRLIHNMGVPASELTGPMIAALANFYASQVPFSGGKGVNAIGAMIYQKGAKDIPACQGCHGARGEGTATAPRLAGQHKGYLKIQLEAFGMAARVADPMNHHVWVMTADQAEGVAAYLGN